MSQIEQFSDDWDIIHDKPGAISQNGARFTAELLLALQVKNTLSHALMHRFTKAYESLSREPGIYDRHPTRREDADGIDNFISLGTASYLLQLPMAKEILQRLRRNFYLYNNTKRPFYKNWACFFPWWNQGAVAHLQFCTNSMRPDSSRECPNIFRRIWWCAAVMIAAWQGTQDGFCQSWQMCRVYQYQTHKFFYMDLVVQFFLLRLFTKYPDGIGQVLEKYWQRSDHPTITLMKGTA